MRFDTECPEPILRHSRRETPHFNVGTVFEEFLSATGSKCFVQTKMMLNNEWVAKAQQAEFGEYTESEALKFGKVDLMMIRW